MPSFVLFKRFEKKKTFPYLPLSESIDGTEKVFKVIDL